LVDDVHFGAGGDHAEEFFDAFGVEADAAVRDAHAHAFGFVGAVQQVGRVGEAHGEESQRVVGSCGNDGAGGPSDGSPGDLTGDADDGVPANVQYQWLRDGSPISGQTGATYQLTRDDAGHKITVRATYKDNAGHNENPLSEATAAVADVPAPNPQPNPQPNPNPPTPTPEPEPNPTPKNQHPVIKSVQANENEKVTAIGWIVAYYLNFGVALQDSTGGIT